MPTDPKTAKTFKDVTQKFKLVTEARKAIEAKLKPLDENVRADAKLAIPVLGSVHVAALEQLVKEVNTATAACRAATLLVTDVVADAAYVAAHLKSVEDLQALGVAETDKLVEHYRLAKELQNLAEANSNKMAVRPNYSFEVLSKLEKQATELVEQVLDLEKKLDPLLVKARKCQQARDAKGLAETQKAAAALKIEAARVAHGKLDERLDAAEPTLLAKHAGDAKAKAAITDAIADIRDKLDRCGPSTGRMLEEAKEIAGLKVVVVDAKKAMKALGITAAGAEAKLAKVLASPSNSLLKGLSDLGKELGLASTGQAMLDALKRNKLI